MVHTLPALLRPPSPGKTKSCQTIERYGSIASVPTITAITQPLPIRRSGTEPTFEVQARHATRFCGIPLSPPKRRHCKVPSFSARSSRPYTPSPLPDPCKESRDSCAVSKNNIMTMSMPFPTSLSRLDSETCLIPTVPSIDSKPADTQLNATNSVESASDDERPFERVRSDSEDTDAVEIVRTRDSEMHHIAQIRSSAASRAPGHWRKVRRVEQILPRERQCFETLRRRNNGPVLRAEIVKALCDERHRPIKLQQMQQRHEEVQDEYWDIDPFDHHIYLVEWLPDESSCQSATNQSQCEERKKRRPWSVYSTLERPPSAVSLSGPAQDSRSRVIGIDEISTIRLVM